MVHHIRSPFHKECPACIRQPHARQAFLCPSVWPGQVNITTVYIIDCYGARPPGTFKNDSWGLPPAAQPSPALPSPRLASPTPNTSTSTYSRRAAKAKARGNEEPQDYIWQNFVSMAQERGWYCWWGGGCGGHQRMGFYTSGSLHWSGSAAYRRPHPAHQ